MAGKQRTKKPTGRPSKFTQQLFAEICERMALGETLTDICKDAHMPSRITVVNWVNADEELSRQYARAREAQADFWADQLLEIADDGTNDWIERTNGDGDAIPPALNHEHIQRSKVRIETRQWMMERVASKVYGRKQEFKHDASEAFANLWKMVGSGEK
jgi:hypothetical protein